MSPKEEQAAFNEAFAAANAAFQQEEWPQALALCEEVLAQNAQQELVWLLKARCLVLLGQWMPAREAFAQTLRINMGNYSAWLEAGHLCRQMGELQQAALSYQKAIDVAPQRYEALLGMARVLMLQGHEANANRAYQDAAQAAGA